MHLYFCSQYPYKNILTGVCQRLQLQKQEKDRMYFMEKGISGKTIGESND